MGFGTMIVGFFFIFFNFNLGPVNIFPDIIGYVLLYVGAGQIFRHIQNRNFTMAKKTSLLLIVLSALGIIVKYVEILNGVLNNSLAAEGKLYMSTTLFLTAFLSIFFFFHLAKGIGEEAGKLGNANLQETAEKTYKLYTVFQVIGAVVFIGATLLTKNTVTYQLGGEGFFLVFGLLALYIYLFIQVRKMLKLASANLGTIDPNEP
ncbi:hypothetical protein D1B31_21195 [Neobacillus notoginsengisoli]|uniref:Uncharacterized protein n=1 Tax=Neobacillus notoginsengisoli TaxID=1578198 RepID=A0A417YHT1_9BACI|nr:hypothetical protein [Neobacillus notoginsengisoli]RHW32442.1 hypothetical protein D1B31_21195 [Neobacillus notoginsengisoli]